MAIIALKKAISLHPDFYEANESLGVCYVMVGKEDKAKAAFQQVINAGDTSIKALDYLKKLKSPEEEIEVKALKKKSKKQKRKKQIVFLSYKSTDA